MKAPTRKKIPPMLKLGYKLREETGLPEQWYAVRFARLGRLDLLKKVLAERQPMLEETYEFLYQHFSGGAKGRPPALSAKERDQVRSMYAYLRDDAVPMPQTSPRKSRSKGLPERVAIQIVAQEMGVSESTVRSILKSGRDTL